MSDVLVVGHPRSGNTHLARLLGGALNSPVTGIFSAHPIAEEGLDRPGAYTVRQLHLMPSDSDFGVSMPDGWTFSLPAWKTERVFWIVRDPRDVAVSVMAYWEFPDVWSVIQLMSGERASHLKVSWLAHMQAWWEVYQDLSYKDRLVKLHYENLLADPLNELVQAFAVLDIKADRDDLVKSIAANDFKIRKADIEAHGDDKTRYPMYNKGIQSKNLRKGVAGDWKNHFTRADAEFAQARFGRWLVRLGYETDGGWVEKVK